MKQVKAKQNEKEKGKKKPDQVKAKQNAKGKGKQKKEEKQKQDEVKRKRNGKGKGEVKQTKVVEKVDPTYVIEKLMNDKTIGGVWKIEVKWKDHIKTTWEPVKVLKSDQPAMVKKYMQHLKKKPEKRGKTTKNTIGKTGATTQQRKKGRIHSRLH